MTTTWHGYPQAEGAHPERPWWRVVDLPGGREWRRADGRCGRGGGFMTTDETVTYGLPPYVCVACGAEFGSEGHACKGLAWDGVPVILAPTMPPDTVALLSLGEVQYLDAEGVQVGLRSYPGAEP